ncbi:MAG: hypothetical protein GQ547_02345 [Methylophaga sp.]|nr:hypothetical protein [Methylophaga sp.]
MNESSSANPSSQLITELQSLGLQLLETDCGVAGRRGGAGPSDHKAVTLGGRTVMIPIFTAPASTSPFVADTPDEEGHSQIYRDGRPVGTIGFPSQPLFYNLKTQDGIPYSHIATLHASDVLATTVLQSCIRYNNRQKSCQFCAIGQSLEEASAPLRTV